MAADDRRMWRALTRDIWIVGALAGAIGVVVFSWYQLWLEPKLDADVLPWWQEQLYKLVWWPVAGLIGLLVSPYAGHATVFKVMRGRFVVPSSSKVRIAAVAITIWVWGTTPAVVINARRLGMDSWTGGCLAVLVLAVTVFAVLCWYRTVSFTPAALEIRSMRGTTTTLSWNDARPHLATRPYLFAVDPELVAAAIDHYREHPEHRAAIGTDAEHERLMETLSAFRRSTPRDA